MGDSMTLLDMFVRGIAVSAMLVTGLSFLLSPTGRDARIATFLASLSICCWLINESHTLWEALGRPYPIDFLASGVSGLFWLFVVTVFGDRPLRPAGWAPAAILVVTGVAWQLTTDPAARDWIWAGRNVFSALLSLHAAFVIAQGWSGDLLEARRRLRGLVMGFGALLAVTNVVIAFIYRAFHSKAVLLWSVGEPLGGAIFSVLMVAGAVTFLQARPMAIGGPPRRASSVADGRADAADGVMLQKLNALMAGGAWRREGLTIGAVAAELGEPEHRLRRLINQRLGHRNFSDFVNSYRIEAAKLRLADPTEARTTVAAIAFDLGYGSLGPFNRAFRAATGASPTEWRKAALQASPKLQEAV